MYHIIVSSHYLVKDTHNMCIKYLPKNCYQIHHVLSWLDPMYRLMNYLYNSFLQVITLQMDFKPHLQHHSIQANFLRSLGFNFFYITQSQYSYNIYPKSTSTFQSEIFSLCSNSIHSLTCHDAPLNKNI